MKRVIGLVAVLVMVATACGDDDSSGIQIGDPWARTSAAVQNAGAAYMTITAANADELTGVSVDSSVAGMAELHESTMGTDGMMMMQAVPSIDLPANASISLEPGGYHVMLMNLAEPLVTGAEFDLTLHFAVAGDITVAVVVREG